MKEKKIRISATVDKNIEKKLKEFLKNSRYRNKSHFIEEKLKEALKKEGGNVKK